MIRLAKEKDYHAVDKYCFSHEFRTPTGLTFISEDEFGNVSGVIGAQVVTLVEPMAADNPFIARSLYDHLMGALKAIETKKVYAHPKTDRLVDELERLEFVIVDKNVTYMEKEM